jgi:hypothetical protein
VVALTTMALTGNLIWAPIALIILVPGAIIAGNADPY